MQYFKLQFRDYLSASEAIWAVEEATGQPHTSINVCAVGSGETTTLWVGDAEVAQKYREQLTAQGSEFEEDDFQKVLDWFDGLVQDAATREQEALRIEGIVH